MQQARTDNRIGLVDAFRNNEQIVATHIRRRLDLILELEAEQVWLGSGHRDLTEWIAAEMGISRWHAHRMVNAAHRIGTLPHVEAALRRNELSLEHVVELCRFVTPETERKHVTWAKRVKPKAVRRKADRELRKTTEEAADADRSRFLTHWWMDDGRLGIEAVLPPDQGAVVITALDRIADRVADIVDADDEGNTPPKVSIDVRRADALYALASSRLAHDQDVDRATIVVRAPLEALSGRDERRCWIDNGPTIAAETVRRLSCDTRIEFQLHNELGTTVGIGRIERTPPAWMKRALKHRDEGCTFPGCDSKRFLHAHHVVHWGRGGRTDLDNLVLVCTFHHKLVHEYGWDVDLHPDGGTRWRRPGGELYEPDRAGEQENKVA